MYKNAVTNAELVTKVSAALKPYDYGIETLVATSLCSDEVNRPLEESFYGYFGQQFKLGGLAGFPFAGLTGFTNMASHVPDNGSCLLVYGPHVGISVEGQVGMVNRRGKSQAGSCCSSAIAASHYVTSVYKGEVEAVQPVKSVLDAQQKYVASSLLPHAEQIVNSIDPMVELPYAMFKPIDEMMMQLVAKTGEQMGSNGRIAMLGVRDLSHCFVFLVFYALTFHLLGYTNKYTSWRFGLLSPTPL